MEAPSFFQGLSPAELAWVHQVLERRSVAAGTLICAEGDSPCEMYAVEAGHADVFIADRHGIERRIAQIGPGATIGEMALFSQQTASASVRATSAMELLALSQSDFERVAATIPRIYQNLGAILSQRLARANRAAVAEERGRSAVLLDRGAPALLGYALACSLAWHTRRATLLLVIAGQPPAELRSLAGEPPLISYREVMRGALVPTRRAHLLIAPPEGDFAPAALPETIAQLTGRYDFLLVQTGEPLPATAGDRQIVLLPAAAAAPGEGRPGHAIRAWSPGPARRPDQAGVLGVPPLDGADEQALRQGLLPATTPAGRAVGWAARDLARLKVGLALGAGSIKGYAHFGVLRALERLGLEADYVSGTSIGAIIAAMYGLGYSADEAARIMTETSGRAFRLGIPSSSLLSSAGVRANFHAIGGDKRFEDLPISLAVVTADIVTGREVVLRRGLLRTAVLASMSIPGIYPPVSVGDMALVDGGVLNPVPGSVAIELGADIVIAVSLGNLAAQPLTDVEAAESRGRLPGLFQVIMRSIELMQSKIETNTASGATILIEPRFEGVAVLGLRAFNQGGRYIELGEAAAEQARARIEAALPWLRR